MSNKNAIIYGLVCPLSNKIRYIGQTIQKLESRLKNHLYDKRSNPHKRNWINKLEKLGMIGGLKIEIIERCDIILLNEREKFWIEKYKDNNLVNKTDGGDCNYRVSREVVMLVAEKLRGRVGRKLTNEQKIKISESHKGKTLSNEHKKKISEGLKKSIYEGKITIPERTEEYKKKISEGLKKYFLENPKEKKLKVKKDKNNFWTEYERSKWSEKFSGEGNPFYGKKHSIETINKMSEIKNGKNIGSENPFYGKTHSLKTKKLLSELVKNKLKSTIYANKGDEIIEFNFLDEINSFLNVKSYMNVLRNYLNTGKKYRGFIWTK